MDVAPSMVQRSGDKLIVRRVVSGEQVHLTGDLNHPRASGQADDSDTSDHSASLIIQRQRVSPKVELITYDSELQLSDSEPGGSSTSNAEPNGAEPDQQLPQCKIKRNYSCSRCTYFTQNPRKYLMHLRDTHGEKIVINECKRCLYASRHYQKLVRHMKMVHGSVDGIRKSAFGASRRRAQNRGGVGQTLGHGHGLHGGTSSSGSSSKLKNLTTAYMQQLVASGIPKILEQLGKSAASNSALVVANLAREQSQMMLTDLEKFKQSMPYSTDETIQEASGEGDRIDSRPSWAPEEDIGLLVSKKRSRPIPNLIPLNMSTSGRNLSTEKVASGVSVQRFVKPIPLATLRGENDGDDGGGNDLPLSLTKHHPQPAISGMPMTSGREDIMTKCMYCELAFKTVEALANHINLAHKDDLIASLLGNTLDPLESASGAKGPTTQRAPETDRAANVIWKRLLRYSNEVVAAAAASTSDRTEGSASSKEPLPASVSNDETDDDSREEQHQSQTFCGVETAPGYGEVTNRLPTVEPGGAGGTPGTLMKKVFKCPHCSFWASTASRFHVHIVGHLNKKPFECSLCAYRSNWRWDITKHIRLKTIRDPSHQNAGVLMNDETGRRNYTKYNKYIALMQITDK